MGLFRNKKPNGGIMDVIRCDESSYLIWKWRPKGAALGNSQKENSVRWGSSLIVKEGSAAVFVYSGENGINYDYIIGPFSGILETYNLPVISNIVSLVYGGNAPFPAEVYFINLANIIQVRFAVPYFDLFDPRFSDIGVPTAVRGTISFKITDYREFIKLHRLDNFSLEDFQTQIRNAVIRYVKSVVSNVPMNNNIPVVQIERYISEINDIIEQKLKERLLNDFGVTVSGVDISAVEPDKTSEGYKYLMSVTRDISADMVKAQAEVTVKEMRADQKLNAFQKFTNIKEDAYQRHKQTQSGNFAAYQVEAGENVGIAGAKGLGRLGSNGGSAMSGGFDPAAMVVGMNLGNNIGQNLSSTMNNVMGSVSQPVPTQPGGSVPPPPPSKEYHIAVNGQTYGPYNLAAVSQMITNGQITKDTYIWSQGMSNWVIAGELPEIRHLFNSNSSNSTMPPLPN